MDHLKISVAYLSRKYSLRSKREADYQLYTHNLQFERFGSIVLIFSILRVKLPFSESVLVLTAH